MEELDPSLIDAFVDNDADRGRVAEEGLLRVVLAQGGMSEGIFVGLVHALASHQLSLVSQSVRIPLIFLSTWECLSADQRTRLRAPLRASIGRYSSELGSGLAAHCLGRYRDSTSVEELSALVRSADFGIALAGVVELGNLAREVDPPLREEVLAALATAATDASPNVKELVVGLCDQLRGFGSAK